MLGVMSKRLVLQPLPLASPHDCPSFVVVATSHDLDHEDLAAELRAAGIALDAWVERLPNGQRTVEIIGPAVCVRAAVEALGFDVVFETEPAAAMQAARLARRALAMRAAGLDCSAIARRMQITPNAAYRLVADAISRYVGLDRARGTS